jgi:peptidoglycan/LPS O-acetylase OafA/YrhL
MTYYKQLDGLRAIAVIAVMIAHWHQNHIEFVLLRNLPYGTGVTLFFVLSGFLITKILMDFKEKNASLGISQFHSIKSFYIRRSIRIFPIYYLVLLVVYLLGFSDIDKYLPWFATYTTNIYMTLEGEYIGPYTHFWSLAVEEQFYIFWVFVVVFIPRNQLKKTILFVILASILLLYYFRFYTSYWLANSLVICSMHSLGLGALIAYYQKYEHEKFSSIDMSKVKYFLYILALIFILIFVYRKPDSLFESFSSLKDPLISLIYAVVVLIAIKDGFTGIFRKVLENKVMIYLGRISYGLYIYHMFMNPLYFNLLNKYVKIQTTNLGYTLIFFLMNVALASISWYLVEKPINNLKRYFNY